MSDLIDRMSLAEHKFPSNECNGFGEGPAYRQGWNDAIDAIIDNAPSAEPEPHWIPVTERMPDEDFWTGAGMTYSADVLMSVFNAADDETIIDYGHTSDGKWYSDTTNCFVPDNWTVTAWMPLPEGYKGGEEQ